MLNEELLHDLYYIQHNYDGINNLYKKAKVIQPSIKKDLVKKWFEKQQTKQMNDDKVIKKEFLPIFSEAPYSFQIDLTFFPRYKKQNNNYYVLFTAVNVNSRYAYAYYAKDKNTESILNLLKEMEKETVINVITLDEGTEFKNGQFIKFCSENDIKIYWAKADSHILGIVNRFHRTIKDKLTKYFSAHDTVKWINVIDKIIYNYNHTVNRGIGIEPYKVNSFIENQIIQKAKDKTLKLEKDGFSVGDLCRIKLERTAYTDKLQSKWSSDIYEIVKVRTSSVIIKDEEGNKYKAKKYEVKVIKEVENRKELKERVKANKEHRVVRKIKQLGVNIENIVEGKRKIFKPT